MSIFKITGLSLLFLACCLILPAQSFPTQSPPTQSGYRIQRFTTDNGLPSNGIKGLQWDERTGFLWIATEAGVTRYNGTDFQVFNKSSLPAMYSERMLFLLKTQDGRIYSTDEAGDIFFVHENRLAYMGRVRLDTRPTAFKLTGLIASDRLFRQSSGSPPTDFGYYWNQEQLVPLSEERLLLTHNDTLYDYRLGRLVPTRLATLEKGARIFRLEGILFVFLPEKGCYRLDPDNPVLVAVPMAGWKVDEAKGSLFWDNGMKKPILTSGPNAWELDYSGGTITPRLICTAVPTDALLSFIKYDDKSGLLFVGTQSKGIAIIRKNEVWTVRKAAPPDQSTACYSQISLGNGAVLTSSGEILGGKPRMQYPSLPEHTAFNNFVYFDKDSTLWYSREDSIFAVSPRTHRTTMIRASAGSITDGFVRSGDSLYIGNAVGVGVVSGDHVDYRYRYPQPDVPGNVPFSMIEMQPGLIAIATCEGLFRYHTTSRRLDTLLRMPGTCVRALWKYRGFLFIGTYGQGIWLFKDGNIRPVPLDKRGYLQYAHCFIPDSLGYCWISTNRGLFRVRPEEMTAAFEDNSREIDYHYYGREDGMDMTELNGGCTPCALALNDSTLSFPSMDGLVRVDPRRPIPFSLQGSVYIDEFTADGKPVNPSGVKKSILPANTRDLVFNLAFPAWVNRENLHIEYKLEPFSKDWQDLDLARGPELQGLPYGNYRLLVHHTHGADKSDPPLVINSFYIRPHWYQQPWSWLLACLPLIAIVIFIVRWRTRQFKIRHINLEKQIAEKTRELQEKNDELERTDDIKTRLISIISHDLVTPLRFLHLTGKNLIERRDDLTEPVRNEAIAEIATTAKELELLSTNILNWIKYRNEDRRLAKERFDLHELVSQLFGVVGALARQKRLCLINDVSERLVLYQFNEPVRIVLYNLLLNGINFTTEGSIRVTCENNHDGAALQIQDTGVGMTRDQINNIMADHFIISSANVDNRKGNGLGYLIIKDLLKILRGNLTICSEKEKGTTVTVWIPS
jgi:signal transduction histidine kinase